MYFKLPYGYKEINFDLPDNCYITSYEPRQNTDFLPQFLENIENEGQMIEAALDNPIDMDTLEDILGSESTVAIIVDDLTRPTPTKLILKSLLKRLENIGIPDDNIDIIFAYGIHRVHTEKEKELILGSQVLNRYRVIDHDAHNIESLISYGITSRGTPVSINKEAARADLRILTGIIKPHCHAAYSGGGKSILPGIASKDTIVFDHNYESIAKGNIGMIEENPMRNDIEEAAGMFGPSFILNVVLDSNKKIIGAVAGDMIKAHRVGCYILDGLCAFTTDKQFDIGIAACGAPIDINLYQAINGIVSFVKTKTPVLRNNGVIILAAQCREGIGHSILKKWEGISANTKLDKLKREKIFEEGIWSFQVLNEARNYADIIVVSEEKNRKDFEAAGLIYSRTMDEAMTIAIEKLNDLGVLKPEVLVLPNAPFMIMNYKED